jgi:hypothetical protein
LKLLLAHDVGEDAQRVVGMADAVEHRHARVAGELLHLGVRQALAFDGVVQLAQQGRHVTWVAVRLAGVGGAHACDMRAQLGRRPLEGRRRRAGMVVAEQRQALAAQQLRQPGAIRRAAPELAGAVHQRAQAIAAERFKGPGIGDFQHDVVCVHVVRTPTARVPRLSGSPGGPTDPDQAAGRSRASPGV